MNMILEMINVLFNSEIKINFKDVLTSNKFS